MPSPQPPSFSARAIEQLAATVEYPIVLDAETPKYRLLTAALLTKIIGASKRIAIFAPFGSLSDLSGIVRSNFEHLVFMAWVSGSDHKNRVYQWGIQDMKRQIKQDNGMKTVTGNGVLDPKTRADYEARIEAAKGTTDIPDLPRMTKLADEDWKVLFREDAPLMSLSVTYDVLYRGMSSLIHPTLIGMETVWTRTEDEGKRVFEVEQPGENTEMLVGMSVSVLTLALAIASKTIGKSDVRQLDAIMDSLMADVRAADDSARANP
jgi:hypothetical protein